MKYKNNGMEISNLQIIECPRDAMQGWHELIPTDKKIEYINALLQVGFHTIDVGSFVSPKAIPQMADTKEVLANINMTNTKSKLLAIVANKRGAEDAVLQEKITYLGFPFSISPTFQQRNTNSTIEASFALVKEIQALCIAHNKQLVIYLSMAFGNPYNDMYNETILIDYAKKMADIGISIISLADTVGMATEVQIDKALQTLIPAYADISFGIHLHTSPYNWYNKLDAAIKAKCTRIDVAINGIGGCPMAADSLVGNLDTNNLLQYFETNKIMLDINIEAYKQACLMANSIFKN